MRFPPCMKHHGYFSLWNREALLSCLTYAAVMWESLDQGENVSTVKATAGCWQPSRTLLSCENVGEHGKNMVGMIAKLIHKENEADTQNQQQYEVHAA